MARAQFPTKPNAHTPVREKSDLGSASGKRIWAWPSEILLRYVREHYICESSNRGIACLARNSSFGAPYAVWFVVSVVNLRVASGKRMCVWPAKTMLRYVREHDICESLNRGIAFFARNSLFRAPYAVWLVVIVANLRAASGKPI